MKLLPKGIWGYTTCVLLMGLGIGVGMPMWIRVLFVIAGLIGVVGCWVYSLPESGTKPDFSGLRGCLLPIIALICLVLAFAVGMPLGLRIYIGAIGVIILLVGIFLWGNSGGGPMGFSSRSGGGGGGRYGGGGL